MFDEKNPNNLIESRQKCGDCCVALFGVIWMLILAAGILVTLHYTGTYLLFGFIVAGSPNNNRITGCPDGTIECYRHQKMVCYQEDMSFCHMLGLVTLFATILGLLFGLGIIIGTCIGVYEVCNVIYDITNTIIQSYKTASNMAENSENNYDITSESTTTELSENIELPNVGNVIDEATEEIELSNEIIDIEYTNEKNILLDD
jgi:hypothetical protein